jgi:hypothetical protein
MKLEPGGRISELKALLVSEDGPRAVYDMYYALFGFYPSFGQFPYQVIEEIVAKEEAAAQREALRPSFDRTCH